MKKQAKSKDPVSEHVFPSLQGSGFPFQAAIAETARVNGRWRVKEEAPWRDELGKDHFVDFMACSTLFVLAVECKKTEEPERDHYTFLLPMPNPDRALTDPGRTRRARCVFLEKASSDSRDRPVRYADWKLLPRSSEAPFCVGGSSDKRQLEAELQLLLRGADAHAARSSLGLDIGLNVESEMPFVPVFVTNARLFTALMKHDAVSLSRGRIEDYKAVEVTEVDFVRFRKTFLSHPRHDLGERTVFVVRATAFNGFISDLSIDAEGRGQSFKAYLPTLP